MNIAEEPSKKSGAIKYVCINVTHCISLCICFVTLKMLGNCILILPIFANILSPQKGLLVAPNLDLGEHLINTSEVGESYERKILTCFTM